MKNMSTLLVLCTMTALSAPSIAADPERQAEVSRLGVEVMPFSLTATTHIFTETEQGGVQRVVAKDAANSQQISLVRGHLRALREQFRRGDFSGPAQIHGSEMPGLSVLQTAKPDQIEINYQDVEGGAELMYSSSDETIVNAIHRWFKAQLVDHGSDAMAGHSQQHEHGPMLKR